MVSPPLHLFMSLKGVTRLTQMICPLKFYFLPITFPVRVSHCLHALHPEEVLTMDTGLRHRGRPIGKEPNDVDLVWHLLQFQDKINLSVNLMMHIR